MQKFYLLWDDRRHNLGIASIDRQHRELVDMVNELSENIAHGCDSEQAKARMEHIYRHAQAHFAHEEELMREHGYPGAEQHAAAHAELLDKAATLMRSIRPGNTSRAVLVTAFLTDCVESHIMNEDPALVRHLREKGLN